MGKYSRHDHFADRDLDRLIAEQRIKLEITEGVPTWRVLPSPRHQMRWTVSGRRLPRQRAPALPCGCHHLSDVYIRFPDEFAQTARHRRVLHTAAGAG